LPGAVGVDRGDSQMNLTVKGRQLDVGEALRTHIENTLGSLFDKYFGDPIETSVVLSRDAHLYRTQISVHVGRGITIQSQADADAPYTAFDAASDHLAKRLRRYKRRLRDHHRIETPSEPAAQYILQGETDASEPPADEVNAAPPIIAEMTTQIPTLSVSEAVMRLDLSNGVAIMFRNSAHGELNMVYRRADGTIGWVDPRGIQTT
jgi:ribosomal subunit interface protein